MNGRWVIAAVTSMALVGVGFFARRELKNRGLAKRAAAYRVLAENGDANSQFRLGSMYYYGTGVPKDYAEAIRWYGKSAEHGNPNAQYSLARMYHKGEGVARDDSEAFRWGRKAAEQGNPEAEDVLGFIYLQGKGVQQDYAEAARWYRKSADHGNANAQYALGYLYYSGQGVPQDRAEADRLFHEAAAQGDQDAKRALGLNMSHPAVSKIRLPLEFVGSFILALGFPKVRKSHRIRPLLTAFLLICFFVMDLFWYSYVGHLQSPATLTGLYLARQFVGGVICALLFPMVFPRSNKAVVILATALFISFVVFRLVLCELRHIPVTLRLLCFAGFPLGMAITSAIFLWLDHKSHGKMPDGRGTSAVTIG
jgi:Sel1 repeat